MIGKLKIVLIIMLLTGTAQFASGAIADTKHNLSVSGPGAVRASGEAEICIFCHVPHNSLPNGPLWNRRDPGSTYTPYSSSSAKATFGQPTGSSLLCLSCHDGTIALGEVNSRTTAITMVGGTTTMPAGSGHIGTALSDDHPISFPYTDSLATTSGKLASPSTLTGAVKLKDGLLQCTTCHDAHDNSFGMFLVADNKNAALCTTCHIVGNWAQSSHGSSGATWSGVGTDPWPHTSYTVVSENACENCHRPHSAGGEERLLNYMAEEDNCYSCHNGNVAGTNIQGVFAKTSRHPVAASSGVHDINEAAVADSRHVECADCHNPHAATTETGVPTGALSYVRGVSAAGQEVATSAYEYEICFRCHADSTDKPASSIARQIVQTNTRLEFNTSNPSFHPVVGAGVNPNVPSLISPLTTSSVIKCTDCHNSDTGPGAGGTGPNGPHGSTYSPILERQYLKADNTTESATAYALCYKCHSRTSILADASFRKHNKHIVGVKTPCSACHDAHGISSTQGNSTNNGKLINWDTTIVKASSSGQLKFVSTGIYKGSCYLKCHNKDHNPLSY